MKSFAILALFASCSLGVAQTNSDIKLPSDVRIYEPKNLTADRAQRVVNSVRYIMNNAVGLGWDDVMHAFVIRSSKPELVDMAESLIKRSDVPEPRIELTVYLVRASLSSQPAGAAFSGNPLPADLKAAIDEMKGAFNYAHYSLWDAIILELKGNGGETQGILPANSPARPYVYTVGYGLDGGGLTESKTLNLAHFTFSIKMPEDLESHIRTDVTVREGQKLVLGKIRLLPSANADLFLVLTTKVY
jgi:hypothetical protein